MQEIWADVPGFRGVYSASTHGRIRREDSGRILEGTVTKKGYRQHHLCMNGVRSTAFTHKLVLLAFAGPCPEGQEGCHGNGDPLDNRIENLRWDTHAGNQSDRKAHGNYPTGHRHPMSKLDERQAAAILADPRPTRIIATAYGVSMGTVQNIKGRKNWKHLSGPAAPVSFKKAKFHPDFQEDARAAFRRKR